MCSTRRSRQVARVSERWPSVGPGGRHQLRAVIGGRGGTGCGGSYGRAFLEGRRDHDRGGLGSWVIRHGIPTPGCCPVSVAPGEWPEMPWEVREYGGGGGTWLEDVQKAVGLAPVRGCGMGRR